VKCFVLSLHRSGTRSTAAYLEALGVRTRHWPIEHEGVNLQDQIVGRETDLEHVAAALAPVLDSYDAVADVPIPVLYRQLLARYPEAKFLLLYRHAFDWLRSVRWKLRQRDFAPYVRTVYWTYFDRRPARIDELSDADLLWLHGRHLADVIEFFGQAGPEQLGVFDLYAPDSGPRLAAFLGIESRRPLPHLFPRPGGNADSEQPPGRL
jgi:hypothetical protein